jgi:hypothetical protein
MKRLLLAGAVFIATMALEQRPAVANDLAAWCAVTSIGRGDAYWDCQYRTFEECYPNVISGNRGFCNHNPRYEPPVAKPRAHGKRHVRRH